MGKNTIEIAINNWTISRANPVSVIANLNQGSCFQISRNDAAKWALKSPTFIHAYPAIFDGVTKFVTVDDVTDSNRIIDFDYVFVKDYTYGAPSTTAVDVPGNSNISIEDALQRVFRWSMVKNTWINDNCRSTDGVFQAFHIPMSDLQNLFDTSTTDTVYAVIGLFINPETQVELPELVLWNEVTIFVDPSMVEDVAYSIPPFSASQPATNYQLLAQSNP